MYWLPTVLPRQQLLEQIARGNGNPDLQLTPSGTCGEQAATEPFAGSDGDLLFHQRCGGEAGNSERVPEQPRHRPPAADLQIGERLRIARRRPWRAGREYRQRRVVAAHARRSVARGRIQIINAMYRGGNTEKLTEVARTDKDPKCAWRLSTYSLPIGRLTWARRWLRSTHPNRTRRCKARHRHAPREPAECQRAG